MKPFLRKIIAKKNLHLFWSVLGVVIFAVILWVLHKMLHDLRWRDIRDQLQVLSRTQITWALIFTVLGYLVLTGYDLLGVRYLGRVISMGKVIFASFLSYIFSINVGMSVIGASTVRLRLYTAWGLSALDIARLVIFAGLSNWLGLLALLGVSFLVHPIDLPPEIRLPDWLAVPASITLLVLILGYLTICGVRKKPLKIFSWEIALPRLRHAIPQVVIGMLDWCLAAAVLYVLLPSGKISFVGMLPPFLLAMSLALGSHVPGGLGVFEALFIVMMQSQISKIELVGALIIFRAFYYLLPLMGGALLMGGYELAQRHKVVVQVHETFLRWAGPIVPLFFAMITFVCGVVLLFSGALPTPAGHLEWIGRYLPLTAVEISHFIGSLAGVGLLFLAVGLRQRLNLAYWLSVLLLLLGIVVSLLHGAEWREALFLLVTLLPLLACRREFYRRASFLAEPLTGSWAAAIIIVLLGAFWLGLFSYKHVSYRHELWWEFSLHGNAPRFLRAMVGASALAIGLGLARIMTVARGRPVEPEAADLATLEKIVSLAPRTYANLALLGDKQLLFSPERSALIMYGIGRRSRIALGDPVGDLAAYPALVWEFRELCHRQAAFCAFYQVDTDFLPLYIDLGFALQKLGEEARVNLAEFNLEGGERKPLRRELNALEKEGYRFEVAPRERTAELLPALREVSDDWLSQKKLREIGFSLGTFDEQYLLRFPMALVWQQERLVAFANLWQAAGKAEASPDLMRHRLDAPQGIMVYLFTECILWAQHEGFAWFNLGMAPLSGLEARPLAPLWHKVGSMVYRHGEHFYHYGGLRQFKEKFHPAWRPKYLASPGGFALPRVLADIVTLITRSK